MRTSPMKFFSRIFVVATQNDWSFDFTPHSLLRARQKPIEAASAV